MSRVRALFLVLVAAGIAPVLLSCGASVNAAYSAEEMAEVILSSQETLPPLHAMTPEEEDFASRLLNIYLVDPGLVLDGAVYSAEGADADEIAVFELTEEAEAGEVQAALDEYIAERAGTFAGYFPEEAAMIENSAVTVNGDYVALLICEEPADASETFLACFSDDPPPLPSPAMLPIEIENATEAEPRPEPATEPPAAEDTPPQEEYDHDAVLAAWESGDWDTLTPKNREILAVMAGVIEENITEDMEEEEKERILHDWIVNRTYYDEKAMESDEDAAPDPDSSNPYGPLMNQQAICTGYTLTFQLFMDMIGVECITVYGTNTAGEDHAWNMVRLSDGEWYCVDVTWDDRSDRPRYANEEVSYDFYNATSDFLRSNAHVWDESGVPEATSDAYMTW